MLHRGAGMTMQKLSHIDPSPFVSPGEKFQLDTGPKPKLKWIEIKKLGVDLSYQRDIVGKGKRTLNLITECFRWSMFAPVVVVDVKRGRYPIIDGQHRATAAARIGIKKIPCYLVKADLAEQAAAFTAINGNVTRISSMQMFHAFVAGGDEDAIALQKLCDKGGVSICRYPKKIVDMRPGETFAATALRRAYAFYGHDNLLAALETITKTGDGNIGFVRGSIVKALCAIYQQVPGWRKHPRRNAAIERVGIPEIFKRARSKDAAESCGMQKALQSIFGQVFAEGLKP